MAQSLKELNELRLAAIKESREVANASKDGLSAESREKLDKLDAEIDRLTSEIDTRTADDKRLKRLADQEKLLTGAPNHQIPPSPPGSSPKPDTWDGNPKTLGTHPAYEAAFSRFLRRQSLSVADQEMLSVRTDSNTSGGYTVVPEVFASELIKNVDDEVMMRGMCRVLPPLTGAVAFTAPVRTAKAASAAWSSELGSPTADTALAFGKRKLEPHYLSAEIDVSRDFMRVSTLPVDAFIREEIARDCGELMENAYLTGSGSQQPLGILTASNNGISTARDVSTDNTTTAITADGLINAFYSLKMNYRVGSTWMFHRDAIKMIRKLKDGSGQYLWQQGIVAGNPDTILGRPVVTNEFFSNTFTSGLYVGIVGDFSWYWIVDAIDIEILVLQELEARSNLVVYLARMKTDGAPVKEEAFARVKLG